MLDIIHAIEAATNQKLLPLQTTKAERCIIYKFWQIDNISHKLELRVMAETLAEAEATASTIISAIGDYGDTNKVKTNVSIRLNGGGVLMDNQLEMVQRILYFDITKKE